MLVINVCVIFFIRDKHRLTCYKTEIYNNLLFNVLHFFNLANYLYVYISCNKAQYLNLVIIQTKSETHISFL